MCVAEYEVVLTGLVLRFTRSGATALLWLESATTNTAPEPQTGIVHALNLDGATAQKPSRGQAQAAQLDDKLQKTWGIVQDVVKDVRRARIEDHHKDPENPVKAGLTFNIDKVMSPDGKTLTYVLGRNQALEENQEVPSRYNSYAANASANCAEINARLKQRGISNFGADIRLECDSRGRDLSKIIIVPDDQLVTWPAVRNLLDGAAKKLGPNWEVKNYGDPKNVKELYLQYKGSGSPSEGEQKIVSQTIDDLKNMLKVFGFGQVTPIGDDYAGIAVK